MTPFVIVGAGRSGTLFLSRLLTELGATCAHEKAFDPSTTEWPEHFRDGEASWHAVPFLRDRDRGTLVIHQVRHPSKVVASLYGREFFRYGTNKLRVMRRWRQVTGQPRIAAGRRACVRFVERTTPEVLAPGDELDRCIRYWTTLNTMVDKAQETSRDPFFRLKIEEISHDSLSAVFRYLGRPSPNPSAVEYALQVAANQSHKSSDEQAARAAFVTTKTLAIRPEWPRAVELANHYGY